MYTRIKPWENRAKPHNNVYIHLYQNMFAAHIDKKARRTFRMVPTRLNILVNSFSTVGFVQDSILSLVLPDQSHTIDKKCVCGVSLESN